MQTLKNILKKSWVIISLLFLLDFLKKETNIDKDNYYIEYDRLNAIKKALELSNLDDIICVLGRGCEEYLEKNNVLYPFNDKNEILNFTS